MFWKCRVLIELKRKRSQFISKSETLDQSLNGVAAICTRDDHFALRDNVTLSSAGELTLHRNRILTRQCAQGMAENLHTCKAIRGKIPYVCNIRSPSSVRSIKEEKPIWVDGR